MPRVYDDWERLVFAVLDRDNLRQLALASSTETSFTTSTSISPFNFKFHSLLHHNTAAATGESYFVMAIHLANEVVRVSDNTSIFKRECSEINSKAKRLALLLQEADGVSLNPGLYDRPARHIIGVTETVLKKAISLVHKCRGMIRRVFAIIPASSFQYISFQLECSIANISWLLRDDQYRGVPPIAANEPVLCNIWELNAILHTGSVEDRRNAVGSLLSLARESEVYRKLIDEEAGDWIQPLLRLVLEGTPDVQKDVATIITLLGKEDPKMIESTVSSAFENEVCRQLIIKEGGWSQPLLRSVQEESPEVQENAVMLITLLGKVNPRIIDAMVSELFWRILQQDTLSKLKGTVAWAVSELVEVHAFNDIQVFHEHHFIQCLGQLACKTLHDDDIDGYIASMTTRALWHLAKQSWKSCRIIATCVELTCFALFLSTGHGEARHNSAMALLEVTAEAEQDVELRKSVFNPNSPAYKAVLDELITVVQNNNHDADADILIPCIKAIGNLTKTFTVVQKKMVNSLVRFLDSGFNFKPEVARAVCVTLSKITNPDNYLHLSHSLVIVDAGGTDYLVKLVHIGEKVVQTAAMILLCYIAINTSSDKTEVASADVVNALEWATKQTSWIQEIYEYDEKLVGEAMLKLRGVGANNLKM